MNKKIFRSIWITAVIVFGATIIIILGSLYAYFSNVSWSQLKIETDLAAQGVSLSGKSYFEGLDSSDYRITWISSDGTVLYDNEADTDEMENHLEREEVKEALETGYGESSRYSNTMSERELYAAKLLDDGSVIRLSSRQSSVWLLILGFIQPILLVIVIALIISFILAYRLSRRIVEPINNIDPDKPLEYIGKEEYAEIEPLLRKMRAQQVEIQRNHEMLEKASLMRQDFTANVSHELKTPLHSISGYAELIENGMAQEEDIKPFATKIRTEAARLTSLVEDIIELTKLDSGAEDAKWEAVDVFTLAENVRDTLISAADDKNVTLNVQGENAEIYGIPDVVYGIIYNLMDNAIKYNHDGGYVNVLVDDRDRQVVLKVSDNGMGIPSNDIDRIFERFYRVDKSHSKEVGGTGLGLSIVKHGLMIHDAEITVDSEEGKGSTFKVVFSKYKRS